MSQSTDPTTPAPVTIEPRNCVIRSDGTPEGTSISLDGVELADVCTDLIIRMVPGAALRASLRLDVRVTALELLERNGNCSLFKVCANCAKELNAPPAGQTKG